MSYQCEKINSVSLAPNLSTLGRDTFFETFGHLYKREDLDMFLSENHSEENYSHLISSPEIGVWVARAKDEMLAGYMVVGPCGLPVPNMPENSGELKRLYVQGAHQGQGVGEALLQYGLDWMEQNFTNQYLSVYAHNHGAQRFYGRYGFEKIYEYHFMVGNHADPEFIMERKPDRSNEGR